MDLINSKHKRSWEMPSVSAGFILRIIIVIILLLTQLPLRGASAHGEISMATRNTLLTESIIEQFNESTTGINVSNLILTDNLVGINGSENSLLKELQTNVNAPVDFAWTAEADQASASFGYSINTAGDVNGDGYDDLIIGAPYFDNGEANEGMVFLYYGSETGLSPTPVWTAESNVAEAHFGFSISSAGDVNDDGFDDVIIGAPDLWGSYMRQGKIFLYLGSTSGLSSLPNWTAVDENATNARLGFSVSSAGDVNGDGYDDVIAGAPEHNDPYGAGGAAFVYHGSALGLGGAAWSIIGEGSLWYVGQTVAGTGDINNDGYDDVLVMRKTDQRVSAYYGSYIGLSTTPSWTTFSDQSNSGFGQSLDSGDINGDGFVDVIIGSPLYDNGQFDEGRLYIYYGTSTGLPTTHDRIIEGDQDGAFMGFSVGSSGDVNNDGYDDIIVGLMGYNNGEIDEGRAHLHVGSASGISDTPLWISENNQARSQYGYAVDIAGDLNGDSYSDILVGAPAYDNGETDEGGGFVFINKPPLANAGSDQSIDTLSLVTLDATNSSDPEGYNPLSYVWSQTSGASVTLSDSASVTPSFIAPANPGTLTFSLVVTDYLNMTSIADEVVITIENQAPIANAGVDKSVAKLSLVTLSGSGSDPDGDTPLTFQWTQIGGTNVALSNQTSASPTFIAPGDPSTLTFTLVVTDSLGLASAPDEVVITVTNLAPIANAGTDQSVGTLSTVTLDGSISSDPDADTPLTYAWTQTDGTTVTLSSNTSVNPTFTAPDDPDTLTFSLVVTDNLGLESTADEVVITVNNQVPLADAGPDQSVDTLATVTLDGSGSSDPDGDTPLTYSWTQTDGSAVTLSSTTSVSPTFTAPEELGSLTFSLVVTDSLSASSSPDEVTISTNNQSPVANAGLDQSVDTQSIVYLDGSTSSDPDGDMLTFAWTQTAGPAVTLTSATTVTPTFTAPGDPGTLIFSLVVTDSKGTSSPQDEVSITVNNQLPVANAGSDQSVYTLSTVTMDGSASSDPDGDTPLTYAWTQIGGTAVSLSSTSSASPTFTAPADPTTLTFTLVVSDGLGMESTADEVVITIIQPNEVPILTSISSPFVYTYMGESPFTLHVYGENFIDSSFIKWNGVEQLDTVFVSETELYLTLTEDDLSIPGTVEISVVTPPPGGGETDVINFYIVEISPTFREKLTASKVNFDWGDIPDATAYKVQLSTTPDFSVLVMSVKTLTSEKFFDTYLKYSKKYYWRIRPIFGDIRGRWSPVFEFTSMDRLAAPILIEPEGKYVTSPVTLGWASVDNAVKYLVVVAKDPAFTIITKKVKVDSTTYELPLNTRRYYWRVKAIDQYGTKGPWSETRMFKVIIE